MKFTTAFAVASLFSAVFVAASPMRYEDEFEVAGRDFDDFELDARDYHEMVTRDFEDALALYLRSNFGQAIKKAAKDTADIAAGKVIDAANGPSQRTNRPNFAQAHGHGGGAKPVGHFGSKGSSGHHSGKK